MEQSWKRQLRREASSHGMCKENRDALNAIESKEEAIALYKKTIDWALEEDYPDLTTIRRDFSDCEDYGVFVDKCFEGQTLKEHQVYVFHNCSGHIRVGLNKEKRIIPMLYFANGCNMKLLPAGHQKLEVRVPLYIFGENKIQASPSENVVFRTYKFEVNR